MNKWEVKKSTFIIFIVSFILLYYIYICCSNGLDFRSVGIKISYIVLLLNVILALRNRKNIFMFFVYLAMAYFNYSFIHGRYLSDRKSMVALFSFADEQIYNIGILIMAVFTIILFIMDELFVDKKNVNIPDFCIEKKERSLISIILIVLEIFIIPISTLFSFGGQLFEYSVIFIILGVYFSGNNKKLISIWGVLTLVHFIYGNYLGMRVPVLPFVIGYVMMVFHKKINYKVMSVAFILGILVMTMSGIYGDGHSNVELGDAYEKLRENGYALDTAQFAYLHSLIMVKVESFTDWAQKQELFKQFALSQILGNVFRYAKLQRFTRPFYMHYDGGILPYYFYFYFKWFGVVFIGVFLGWILGLIANVKESSKDFYKIMCIFIIAMIPKWYLYEPTQLFRGVFLLFVSYLVCVFMEKVFYKNQFVTDNKEN